MQFITSDDVRLEYDDVGQGEPILIMTGYAGYKEIWRSQVELLSQHYQVIIIPRHFEYMFTDRTILLHLAAI